MFPVSVTKEGRLMTRSVEEVLRGCRPSEVPEEESSCTNSVVLVGRAPPLDSMPIILKRPFLALEKTVYDVEESLALPTPDESSMIVKGAGFPETVRFDTAATRKMKGSIATVAADNE